MLAPIVAWQQNGSLPTRTKSLTIDGLDVLRSPVTTGNAYGVPIESVTVTEAGPGQVSYLTFTIEDPASQVSIDPDAYIRLDDLTRGVPLFAGFLDSYSVSSFGTGRVFSVQAVGIEAVLDWWQVPAITWAVGTGYDAMVQGTLAQAFVSDSGGGLRALAGVGTSSRQSAPIGLSTIVTATSPVAITAGSLRSALQTILDAYATEFSSGDVDCLPSVDFYHGLRVVGRYGSDYHFSVLDWTAITIDGSTIVASNTSHRVTPGSQPGMVYVDSTTTAGAGITPAKRARRRGRVARLTANNSVTATTRDLTAYAYQRRQGQVAAGVVTVDDALNIGTLGSEKRAGTDLTITDANVGLAGYQTFAASITKTFSPDGKERWDIAYGGEDTGTQLLRRLTASQSIT